MGGFYFVYMNVVREVYFFYDIVIVEDFLIVVCKGMVEGGR